MIYSNDRKIELSGWLKAHDEDSYNDPLKLQKFLFFYESFSKVSGETADFDYLRGYENGPVFSSVYGDYRNDRIEFDNAVESRQLSDNTVNQSRAKRCDFVVRILSDEDLSELTHKMNIWRSKRSRILSGEKQVPLLESDFNDSDSDLIRMLEVMYPDELIDNSSVLKIGDHYFVFSKSDYTKLTDKHRKALSTIARHEMLHNPVYVEIDEEGSLLVD